MSKLQYKTIAGMHPQGKPYVYFSCHPKDFERYFEEYASKIMHIEDCAIWYESEPEEDYNSEDLTLELNQMQLFVMPVTGKLLTTPNRAMDVEFPIAQEKHIPVLPLMMEQGLDDAFSDRFGELHYLDPNVADKTRRSFDEVLETYIKSVLFSNKLADKIRAAFDAYIFLSYRKKDRKKAQELMQLIHRNSLCRDIAIWYDEFLIPGENFNQAIRKMLEKSDLFTLVVTPNLVNESNYVMTTEYPVAVKQEKPVLPVEMEKTDRRQLEEHYEAIPPCVRGEENEVFWNALMEKLRKIAVSANDKNPAHNYLIGLAYLNGIDVEVDMERALELITEAAEAEVPEAISQLIAMYETGKGTERDYRKGIEWRKKEVALLRKRYESEPDWDNAWELICKLWDLGDALYAVRSLNFAEEVYLEMSRLAEKYTASGNKKFLRILFVSYDKLGNITRMDRKLAEAKEYYKKGLAISKELARETETVDSDLDQILSYSKLGDIAKMEGNIVRARKYYENGLAIGERHPKANRTVDMHRYLSGFYCKLGDIAKEEGNLAGARECYENCISISRTLEGWDKTEELPRILYVCNDGLGDIAKAEKDLVGAQKYYEECLSISNKLAEKTEKVEPRNDLAMSYSNLGDVARERGNLIEAEKYYKKALEIREALANETDSIQEYRHLATSLFNSGVLYYTSLHNPAKAKEMFERVFKIARKYDDGYLMDLGLNAKQNLNKLF